MKTIVLLHARDPAFAVGLPDILADTPEAWGQEAARIVVYVPVASVGGAVPSTMCAAVLEVWSAEPLHALIAADAALAGAQPRMLVARETIGKAGEETLAQGVVPGFSQLSFLEALEGLSAAQVVRHWREHIPLANRIHVGMTRYVQNDLASTTGGAARWFGMAHLHFLDGKALAEGLFRTPEDIALITEDVAQFVARHTTMVTTGHVVKG